MKWTLLFDYLKENDFIISLFYRYTHQSVVSAALRVVGNIVTGDDFQTQVNSRYNSTLYSFHVDSWQVQHSLLQNLHISVKSDWNFGVHLH